MARWHGAECLQAYETNPDDLVDWLVENISDFELVVCESWTLYPHLTAQFMGSEFLTSQLIGAIRHICRRAQVPCVMQAAYAGNAKALMKIKEFKTQPLRWWKSYGHGPHAKDAEAHGHHFLRMKHRAIHGW